MNKLWSRKNRLAKEKMYLNGDSIEWKIRINSCDHEYKEFFRFLEKAIPISNNYNNITYIQDVALSLERYYRFNGDLIRINSCELILDVYDEDILIDLDLGKSFKIGAISMLTEEQSCYLKYLMSLSYYIVLKVNKGYYQMYDYRFHNVAILDDFLELEVTLVPNS